MSKQNAPAVSQLAGEIARKIFPNPHDKKHAWFDHGRVERQQENAAEIISASLSERESKVTKLIETLQTIADFATGNGDVCEIIARRARAAISEVGHRQITLDTTKETLVNAVRAACQDFSEFAGNVSHYEELSVSMKSLRAALSALGEGVI